MLWGYFVCSRTHLGTVVRNNSGLQCLSLANNILDDRTIKFVAEGLGVNKTLKNLSLKNTKFGKPQRKSINSKFS